MRRAASATASKFAGPARSRLFDQHVFSRGRRLGRDRRQLIVRRGDEDRVDIVAAHGRAPVGGRLGAGRGSGQLRGARRRRYRSIPSRYPGGSEAARLRPISPQPTMAARTPCFWGQTAL